MHSFSRVLRVTALTLLAFATALLTSAAHAAKITKVKGKSVTIDTEGEEISKGDSFFVMVDGKKKAIIKISKVKGKKAVAKVKKGTPVEGATLQLRQPASSAGGAGGETDGESVAKMKSGGSGMSDSDTTYGVLAGYALIGQSIKLGSAAGANAGQTITMADSGINVKGFADIPIAGDLGILTRVGMEQFAAKAETLCENNVACATQITYFTADLLLRYKFLSGSFQPYFAGGLGIFYPISKKTNVLDPNRISATSVFFATGGANVVLSPTMYIPFQVEYALFPPSEEVSTSMIVVRSGLGFMF